MLESPLSSKHMIVDVQTGLYRGQAETNSKLADGRFHKQERLVLGDHEMDRAPHLPARNLKVYIDPSRLSDIPFRWSQ